MSVGAIFDLRSGRARPLRGIWRAPGKRARPRGSICRLPSRPSAVCLWVRRPADVRSRIEGIGLSVDAEIPRREPQSLAMTKPISKPEPV